jgi:hypothetical protein
VIVLWLGVVLLILSMLARKSSILLEFVFVMSSKLSCMFLVWVFTVDVIAAIFSVVISSRTVNFVSSPSVVLSRHPVISYNMASI